MTYLWNTAALVRQMGIDKSAILAAHFKNEWIMQEYIPKVLSEY